MALVGVSVTKRFAFRDGTQEFSNVYHYQWPGLDPGAPLAEECLDRVVTIERNLHATDTTFVVGRVWNAGGTQAQNDMIVEKTLTGTGNAGVSSSNFDRERAILFRWRAGTDSKGRPVYLRKWYHSNGFMDVTIAAPITIVENKTGFTTSERTNLKAKVAGLNPLVFNGGAIAADLVSAKGRNVSGELECHKYLEHHQLGDQWRG